MNWSLFALFYAIQQLDNVIGLAIGGLILSCAFILVSGIILLDLYDKDKDTNKIFRFIRKFVWGAGISLVIIAFVPSSKTVMIAVAGSELITAANSDHAKAIAGTSLTIVEKYLGKYLKDLDKKDK